jgi:protein-disulfide isomerase
MSLKKNLLLSVSVLVSFALTSPVFAAADATAPAEAAATKTASVSDASKNTAPVTHAEFEALLKQTLQDHPEMILDSVKKMREKHDAEMKKKLEEAMAKHKDELVNDTKSPSVGDAKTADVTIVEFFDYHCGYCKRMIPTITQILGEDKKVRFIFREFPILSEDSVLAARAAIAAYNIDKAKYFDFHTALMKNTGKYDEKSIGEMAKKVGIDEKKLKKEMESTDITKMLDDNRALAEELGISGTPAIIIDGVLIPGAVPHDDLAKMIDNVRKGLKPDAGMEKEKSGAKKPDEKKADEKKSDDKKEPAKEGKSE